MVYFKENKSDFHYGSWLQCTISGHTTTCKTNKILLLTLTIMIYLNGIKSDTLSAVHTPGEGTQRFSTLLIPDVNLVSTRGKHIIMPMMVHRVEGTLQIQAKKILCLDFA